MHNLEKSPGTGLTTGRLIRADEGTPFDFAGVGGQLKLGSVETGGRFAIAHLLRLPPRVLGAPLHRHHNEDEYSLVLRGTLGVLQGGELTIAETGTWVLKPRRVWHTFWNVADSPCDVVEIVSPAGFERYFHEVATAGGDLKRLAEVNEKYSIDMDLEGIPAFCARFGLTPPEPPGSGDNH